MTSNIASKELIKKIGRRIFVLRQIKGMSREELAYQIGVGQQQLFKYEMGHSRITVDRLIKIANALDLKISVFFPAKEFGKQIGNLTTPQTSKEIRMLNNFAKFKQLSPEDLVMKIMDFLVK